MGYAKDRWSVKRLGESEVWTRNDPPREAKIIVGTNPSEGYREGWERIFGKKRK